jgi:Tol biopolymer transport system component
MVGCCPVTRDPRREPRRILPALLLLLLGLSAVPAAAPASFPPELRFRTLETPRVTLHYHQGLEAMALEAAALSDEILAAHEKRYGYRVARVHVVLADVEDDPNGFATPLPYPLVGIRVVAPRGNDDFGNHDGWLRFVLTHELAHVVHLDEARGIPGAVRKVFGRVPFFFPNALTPTWMVEGLATDEETEGTAFGRGRNPDSRMILRMAALDEDFLAEDEAVGALDRWPSGQAPYLFGEAFLSDISERFGAGTVPALAREHSNNLIPYLDDFTAKKVTGSSFHTLWREWAARARADFAREAARIQARGLTPSCALTDRGIRQAGPRYSPDGARIAYTSRTLTRFRAIRVMAADGSGDRKVADRNGGTTLSWTPDGRRIVFDENERHKTYFLRTDLRVVDVGTGRVRALTRGLRAKEPDVSPDGRAIVFVLDKPDGSELAVVDADGSRLRELTRSAPGTEWSGPRWSPRGDAVAVSRWMPGGWLDVVRVDPAGGEVVELTHDRAKDVEPAWTPDGAYILFRSDRDGVSNVYAARLADGALLRVTNVLGGAFTPEVSPDGAHLVFADYGSAGYDLRRMDLDPGALPAAEPFADPYPPSRPAAAPVAVADVPYRPLRYMRPTSWAPYFTLGDEVKIGAATGGVDPLFRHAWGLDLHGGTETHRLGFHAFYQYDRFRPTFLLTLEDDTDLVDPSALDRTRKVTLRASLPVRRRVRSSQNVSLAWRRSRETLEGVADPMSLDLGGLEAAWSMSTVKGYPYSISPIDGYTLQVAALKEDPALGSEVSLTKALADARAYVRLFGETDTLALRVGGGTTFGRPSFRRSYSVGGFPDGSLQDVVRTNPAVLRGYPQSGGADPRFTGRNYVAGNVEYRFPLVHPQRGWRALPVFLRHMHGAVFADVGHAWTGGFRFGDLKAGAGAALGADTYLGHLLPFTGVLGVARGLADNGETQVYFRMGLAF